MRKHSMPEIKEGGVNVTPLIDVVMCLIIFFMLVAKIGVATGSDKNISVPEAFQAVPIKDVGNTITLNVSNGSGQPAVTALVGEAIQEVKLQDVVNGKQVYPLLATLKYFRDGDPASGRPANPELKVIIRGNKDLTFTNLSPVLIECTKAKVKAFAFAANQGANPVEAGN